MKANFEVELLRGAIDFLENLDSKTREKIYYNLKKSQYVNDGELFKKLNETIWEFRTLYNSRTYRLFAFWDTVDGKDKLVIVTHCILKKSQKTPQKEINKAEDIRQQYLDSKYKKKLK